MVITMAKLSIAHASTHGARKPPGPKPHINNGTAKNKETALIRLLGKLFISLIKMFIMFINGTFEG